MKQIQKYIIKQQQKKYDPVVEARLIFLFLGLEQEEQLQALEDTLKKKIK